MFLLILKKIEIAYKSKYNLIRDNKIILLMISNGKNWHYLAVKSLSRLLRGLTIIVIIIA